MGTTVGFCDTQIRKEMGISYEEAETYKVGASTPSSADVVPVEVNEILERSVDSVAVEIQRSFDFFRATSADQEIDSIILSGGCAKIANLDDFLKERLGIDVEVNDPFQNIVVNEKKFDPQYVQEIGPRAAVAIGLALRKAGDR